VGNRWDSGLCGALLGLAVTGVYFIGAGRAYGYDASVTVHQFVVTPSLLDPLHRQALYNNHVLFSFVDHLVYATLRAKRCRKSRRRPAGCPRASRRRGVVRVRTVGHRDGGLRRSRQGGAPHQSPRHAMSCFACSGSLGTSIRPCRRVGAASFTTGRCWLPRTRAPRSREAGFP